MPTNAKHLTTAIKLIGPLPMLKHYSPASVGTRGPISTCNHRHRGIVQQNYTIRCSRSCTNTHTNTCTYWFILFFIYSESLIHTQDEAFCITIKNEKHSILFYRVVLVFQSQNTKYLISFTRTGFSSITFLISVSSADNFYLALTEEVSLIIFSLKIAQHVYLYRLYKQFWENRYGVDFS